MWGDPRLQCPGPEPHFFVVYNITMDNETVKPRKINLFLIALIIFLVEYLGICGFWWIFGGYMGDASLTISRYVGLHPATCAIFCVCNLAITILVIWHLITACAKRGFLWRFLMYIFIGAFLALSICPHVPTEGMGSTVHRAFAGTMFVVMALIGLWTLFATQRKALLVYAMSFLIYAVFFCICDAARVEWFMNGIFWFESAYIFAFFGLTLPELNK